MTAKAQKARRGRSNGTMISGVEKNTGLRPAILLTENEGGSQLVIKMNSAMVMSNKLSALKHMLYM